MVALIRRRPGWVLATPSTASLTRLGLAPRTETRHLIRPETVWPLVGVWVFGRALPAVAGAPWWPGACLPAALEAPSARATAKAMKHEIARRGWRRAMPP